MAIATWSWIFVLQLILLVQPGCAQLDQNLHRVIARHVMEGVFVRRLSSEPTTKHIFIGVAVAASVFLLAGIASLVIIIRKSHADHAKADPEAALQIPPVEKPNWWMVEGDNKADWWRLSLQAPATDAFPVQVDTKGGRTDRLKNALQLNKAKNTPTHKKVATSPADTITLPMHVVPAPEPIAPRHPQAHEKVYPVAPYPTFSLTPPRSDEDKPQIPAPIVINPVLLRTKGHSERRTGAPRSPALKRRSKVSRNQLRNPFLPPRTPVISRPLPVNTHQLADPKLAHPLGKPRSAFRLAPSGARPPVPPKLRPAPLDLDENVKMVHFGERF